jgi:hypothetical protein
MGLFVIMAKMNGFTDFLGNYIMAHSPRGCTFYIIVIIVYVFVPTISFLGLMLITCMT